MSATKALFGMALAMVIAGCGSDSGPVGDPDPVAPTPGSLVVNEIMVNPGAVDDVQGEWIELYNPTATPIDLRGLVLRDDGTESVTVDLALSVPAGGYVVMGRDGSAASNGGVVLNYAYGSGFTLGNGGDEVTLVFDGSVIDRVSYTGFAMVTGASLSLAPGNDAATNDAAANWCAGTSVYGAGDRGTPGFDNPDC